MSEYQSFTLSILKFKFLSVVFKKHLLNPAPAENPRQMALWNRQKQQKVQHNTFLYIWSLTLAIVFIMCVFCLFSCSSLHVFSEYRNDLNEILAETFMKTDVHELSFASTLNIVQCEKRKHRQGAASLQMDRHSSFLTWLLYFFSFYNFWFVFCTDLDSMSYSERSERSGRQGQRRKHQRWGGSDRFHNDRLNS